MNKQKLIIMFTVFIDVVGIGLVIPTIPLYVERFGATPFITSLLFTAYAFFQFLGVPLLGTLSDRFGRRPILISSLLGTSFGWFIFALANSLPLLFLGRIIDGLTGGNVSTAQSYLVDISKTDKERTENLGLFGAVSGIGFVLGPAIGALLSTLGTSLPFWVAGILALLNTVAAYFFLPETNLHRTKSIKISWNPLKPIVRSFQNKKIKLALWGWFLFSLAFTILQTVFTFFVNRQFGFDEAQAGLLLTLVGLVIAINQGFFLKSFWLRKFSERSLEIISVIVLTISFLCFTYPNFYLFLLSLLIMAAFNSILRAVANSQIAGKADVNQRGEIIGVVQGLTSLAAIIIPPVSGLIFEQSIYAPWYLASFFMFVELILIIVARKKKAEVNTPIETKRAAFGLDYNPAGEE